MTKGNKGKVRELGKENYGKAEEWHERGRKDKWREVKKISGEAKKISGKKWKKSEKDTWREVKKVSGEKWKR